MIVSFFLYTGLEFDPALMLEVDRYCANRMGMYVSAMGISTLLLRTADGIERLTSLFQDRLNRLSLYRLRRF